MGRYQHHGRFGSALAKHEPGAERVDRIKYEPVFPGPIRHALHLGDHGSVICVLKPLNGPSAEARPDDGLVPEFVADPEPSLSHQFRNSRAGT